MLAPVPAALVTCGSEDGKRNVLTAAWTGIVCTRPPMAYVSVRRERYSYSIIRETGEFVINLTTSKMARTVDLCGMKTGAKIDKFERFRLDTCKGETVSCPVILQSPLAIECKVREINELGSHSMFIADITGITADDEFITGDGRINLQKAGLMTYAHGEYFALGRKLGDFGFSVRKKNKKT